MKKIKLYEQYLEERSGELFNPKKNQPVVLKPTKDPELEKEFFNLISTAYAEIGGHIKVQSPSDVFKDPDWNYWEGIDIHGTNDFDVIMFGEKTRFGLKFSGVGHDGTKDAKRDYMDRRGKELKQLGYYIEVSGKIAEILINKYQVPIVTDQAEVEKVLGKKVDWIGNLDGGTGGGWYSRTIGGGAHEKIMLGRPKV